MEHDFFAFLPILFVAAFFVFYYLIERKRKREIEDYATRNGMTYMDSLAEVVCGEGFRLFELGSGHNYYYNDLVCGNKYGVYIQMATYSYVTTYGSRSHTNSYTLCLLQREGVNMPPFFLRKEVSFWDLSWSGISAGKDINFPEDNIFSKKLYLSCPLAGYESAVRIFFDKKVRSAFVSKFRDDYVYEGSRDYFMAFKPGKLNNLERLEMLQNTLGLFNAIAGKKEESFTDFNQNFYSDQWQNNNML